MNAAKTLDAAAGHLRDRAATYDSPGGERSAGKAAAAFNAITGRDLTAGDVYLLQVVLKAVRARQGGFKPDNYEDGAAYFALMGEADAGGSTLPVDAPPIMKCRYCGEMMTHGHQCPDLTAKIYRD